MIPYGRQEISQQDIDEVVRVLKSDFLTQGPRIPEFEDNICKKVGSAHAVAVNSATSALHIACLALGLKEGDILWTVPNSFVASANVALFCGANVDFVDITNDTFLMCTGALEDKLTKAASENKLPKILMPVHFAGQSCNMEKIGSLAKKYNIRVIEDASHAIGAKYKDKPVGDCTYSDVSVFSFHPVKIITTAEGGVATTQDNSLAEKMKILRSHGVTRNQENLKNKNQGSWYYEQIDLGFNYRMTDIQAALGSSQLKRLDFFLKVRNEIASRYNILLKETDLQLPVLADGNYSSYHLYPVQVKNRESVFDTMRSNNIGVNVHYIPIHLQPFYRKKGFSPGDFPNSEEYYSRAISIPLHPGLTKKDQNKIVTVLKDTLKF
jgi:UDP-4-amino-4,6-dideoxy-N-acetyl-beta-L-altrosamine transaminase